MENMLQDLAKLQLNNRPALADQTNAPAPERQAAKPNNAKANGATVEEDLSDDSTGGRQTPEQPKGIPQRTHVRLKKYERLAELRHALSKPTDNSTLSKIVADFATVLKETGTSKMLTIEGFGFLDDLCKKLGDPRTFHPIRTSRTRSTVDLDQDAETQPAHVKLDLVARLKREVAKAPDNKALARMIADFGAVTNRSSSRTITKDGFAFLEGLAARLQALS